MVALIKAHYLPLWRTSFTLTLDSARRCSAHSYRHRLHHRRRHDLYCDLPAAIARDALPEHRDRSEPLVVKYRNQDYPLMIAPLIRYYEAFHSR